MGLTSQSMKADTEVLLTVAVPDGAPPGRGAGCLRATCSQVQKLFHFAHDCAQLLAGSGSGWGRAQSQLSFGLLIPEP